jgi:hypothetical protein
MAIVVPAALDPITTAWGDSVANQLNTSPITLNVGAVKLLAGQTAYSISATNGVAVTVTYGVTFSSLIAFLVSVESGANVPLITYANTTPGLSSCSSVRVEHPTGATVTRSGNVHWLAIGT